LRVNLLSISSLENVGYCKLIKREHVFIYREGVDPMELQLIGDRVERLYMLREKPSVYDSTLDEEHEEAHETVVGPIIYSFILREENESLLSTRSSDEEHEEAHETVVGPKIYSFISREENKSLLSTGGRLNRCD
jgi:hypothetical protein